MDNEEVQEHINIDETSSSPKYHEKSEQLSGGASWTLFYLLVVVAEVLGIICVILIAVWGEKWMGGYAWDKSAKIFNYHPVFMVLGFVFFYGNGMY